MFTGDGTARGLLSLTAVGQRRAQRLRFRPGWLAGIPPPVSLTAAKKKKNCPRKHKDGRPSRASARWTLLARILWVLGKGEGFCRSP